jgi:predicted hotdog family 3-hydroxylacyl-ACP dehydratase
MRDDNTHWTLDKRVPLALILGLMAQSAIGVWWAAEQSAMNREQTRRLELLERQRLDASATELRIVERLASMEAQARAQTETLQRIDARLLSLANGNRQQTERNPK